MVCDIPSTCGSSLIKLLLEKKKWHEVLLLLTRKATKEMTPGNGPVKNCDLSDLDIGAVLNHVDRSDKLRVQLVKCLIERGGKNSWIPKCCTKSESYLFSTKIDVLKVTVCLPHLLKYEVIFIKYPRGSSLCVAQL